MIVSKVKNFFSRYSIRDCCVALAFSGGTDSTALFYLLSEIKDEFNLKLYAIHVNYRLRGDDSDADQRFVEDLCKKHNIELFVKTADISGVSGTEETARIERYGFFEQIKLEKNINFTATAHNADDQAETLLFRLTRKTGVRGAAGILKFRDDGIIRPILDVTRNEILQYLNRNNLLWREDKSNVETKYSRNRIRQNIIPELEKINPAAVLHLAQFCELMQGFHTKKASSSNFLIRKNENIRNIVETCYENGLSLNQAHSAHIEENSAKTGNVLLLPDNFKMYTLKHFLFFTQTSDSLEIQERIIEPTCETTTVINDLWKLIIKEEMPPKGEDFAVVSKDDYPLKIKSLSKDDRLKNDRKTAFERMKKAGLSKFERENSPAIFAADGNLLAVPYCSWKFDGSVEGTRWLRVR